MSEIDTGYLPVSPLSFETASLPTPRTCQWLRLAGQQALECFFLCPLSTMVNRYSQAHLACTWVLGIQTHIHAYVVGILQTEPLPTARVQMQAMFN